MRVLVCGSRTWDDPAPINMLMRSLAARMDPITVIHGAAQGADYMAGAAADARGLDVEEYPAQWKTHGRAAGPIRNQQMLEEGKPDVVWAFVDKPLPQSKGTANMVSKARANGVPVYVVMGVA